MNENNHIDLFSGIGGFSIALDMLGEWNHAFVEYEPHLQRVLKKNWPTAIVHGDIREFHPDYSPFLITGGFPCTQISHANTKKDKGGIYGKDSKLWAEYFRVLGECRPRYCIIENVHALLSNGLGVVLQDLARIGYDSAYTVIDSQFCGVPQRRRRVYILGVRDGIPRGADIFNNRGRTGESLKRLTKGIIQKRSWIFEEGKGESDPIAYFTRQRSDEFGCIGVASTITKRDYKDHTDLIVHKDRTVRGLSIRERMKLQGIVPTWLDGCGLTLTQQYQANGMTVPAVKWVAQKLLEFHKAYYGNT